MFDYTDLFFAQRLCPCGQCDHQPASVQNNHMVAPVKVAAPELSGTFRTLPPEPTPAPGPSGTCLRNLHQHAPELSGTCRNPPEPSGTFRNPPEPSRTCLRNLHQRQNSPELSGTLWNSPEPSATCLRNQLLRPAPAHTGAIWAEDPISLRCWEKSF